MTAWAPSLGYNSCFLRPWVFWGEVDRYIRNTSIYPEGTELTPPFSRQMEKSFLGRNRSLAPSPICKPQALILMESHGHPRQSPFST